MRCIPDDLCRPSGAAAGFLGGIRWLRMPRSTTGYHLVVPPGPEVAAPISPIHHSTLVQAHGPHYHLHYPPGISLHTNGAFRLSAISHQVGVPIKRPIQGGEDADLSVSFDGVMS